MQPDYKLLSLHGNVTLPAGGTQKVVLTDSIYITAHGLEADNGIKEYYQDTECALLHYAQEHYVFWHEQYPNLAPEKITPGFFGENISTLGLTEKNVCIGDIFHLGAVELQVSWGREACEKIAGKLNDPLAPEIMHQQSRNGWFYRVLQSGEIHPGDKLILKARPKPKWTLSRVQHALWGEILLPEELESLNKMPELAARWRKLAGKRLEQYATL